MVLSSSWGAWSHRARWHWSYGPDLPAGATMILLAGIDLLVSTVVQRWLQRRAHARPRTMGVDVDGVPPPLLDAPSPVRGRRRALTPQRRQVLAIVCDRRAAGRGLEILPPARPGAGRRAADGLPCLEFLVEQGLVHRLETLHAFVGAPHPDEPHPASS